MKQALGWWFPDHEQHLIEWMMNPKGAVKINGRSAYQGKKQLRAMDFVPSGRRGVAVDVGAHIGLWSFNLAHWFHEVHAFEPVAVHRECFNKNVFEIEAPFSGSGRVNLWPIALGDHDGKVRLTTGPTSSGDTWISGSGEIPMETLDGQAVLTTVDFMKLDCEGYETFILRGGEKMIERCKPVIVVEQKRDMSASRFKLPALSAVKFLTDRGYKTADAISGDYIMVPT